MLFGKEVVDKDESFKFLLTSQIELGSIKAFQFSYDSKAFLSTY